MNYHDNKTQQLSYLILVVLWTNKQEIASFCDPVMTQDKFARGKRQHIPEDIKMRVHISSLSEVLGPTSCVDFDYSPALSLLKSMLIIFFAWKQMRADSVADKLKLVINNLICLA
jgi:hypothetical protein